MDILKRIDGVLAKIETAILLLALTVMVVLSFVQVILRNFFSSGLIWGDTFLRHLVLWVTFLGASLATREERHINIDILSRTLSPRGKKWVRLVINLFAAIVSAFLTKAAFVFILGEKEYNSRTFLNLPLWLVVIIIGIGFGLITFRFLLKALDAAFTEPETEQG